MPSDRMMGLVSVGAVNALLGMWSISVFDFLSCVPVCIWRPNFSGVQVRGLRFWWHRRGLGG